LWDDLCPWPQADRQDLADQCGFHSLPLRHFPGMAEIAAPDRISGNLGGMQQFNPAHFLLRFVLFILPFPIFNEM
jgi:hypothetical protein